MIFFCPINNSKPIAVEIKNAGTYDVTATDKRITIVSIIGPITANDKELITMQHAAVFPGKTAKLVVPKNGVCALVSYA
jgi:redox-sensitive bicupin YhaK (pirin superfamily)